MAAVMGKLMPDTRKCPGAESCALLRAWPFQLEDSVQPLKGEGSQNTRRAGCAWDRQGTGPLF